MLNIFHVNHGDNLVIEVDNAFGKVKNLKEKIENLITIPAEQHVLLLRDGTMLKNDEGVFSQNAGIESNPIFLYTKTYTEVMDPVSISYDLTEKIKYALELSYCYETVEIRTKIVRKMSENAIEMFNCNCAAYHSQVMQDIGWNAIVKNVKVVVDVVKTNFESFKQDLIAMQNNRAENIQLLESSTEVLKTLGKIPLPKFMDDREDQAIDSSTPNLCEHLFDDYWIDKIKSESEYGLNVMTTVSLDVIDNLSECLRKIKEEENNDDCKLIGGMQDRLRNLNNLDKDGDKLKIQIGDFCQIFEANFERVKKTNDASVFPDLCRSHESHLQTLQKYYNKLRDYRKRMIKSKYELCANINLRLGWVNRLHTQVRELNNSIVVFSGMLVTLKDILSRLKNVSNTPHLFYKAISEILRRKVYANNFKKWAYPFSQNCNEIFKMESELRDNFSKDFYKNMISSKINGLSEKPSLFGCSPEPSECDVDLPMIGEEDIKTILKSCPEELSSLYTIDETYGIPRLLIAGLKDDDVQSPDNSVAGDGSEDFASAPDSLEMNEYEAEQFEEEIVQNMQETIKYFKCSYDPLLSGEESDNQCLDTDDQCLDTDDQCLDTDDQCLDTDDQYQDTNDQCQDTNDQCQDTDDQCQDTDEQCQDTDDQCEDTDDQCQETEVTEPEEEQNRFCDKEQQTEPEDEEDTISAIDHYREMKTFKEEMWMFKSDWEDEVNEDFAIMLEEQNNKLKKENEASLENCRQQCKLDMETLTSRYKMITVANMDKLASETLKDKFHQVELESLRRTLEQEFDIELKTQLSSVEEKNNDQIQKAQVKTDEHFSEALKCIQQDKDRVIEDLRIRIGLLTDEVEKHRKAERVITLKAKLATLQDYVSRYQKEVHFMSAQLAVYRNRESRINDEEPENQKIVLGNFDAAFPHYMLYACFPQICIYKPLLGNTVIFAWDNAHNSYRAVVNEKHCGICFLHKSCYRLIGIVKDCINKVPCQGKIFEIERCCLKKAENRFCLPKGSYFKRLRACHPRYDHKIYIAKRAQTALEKRRQAAKDRKVSRQPVFAEILELDSSGAETLTDSVARKILTEAVTMRIDELPISSTLVASSKQTSEVVESDVSSKQTLEVVEPDESSNQTLEVVEPDDSSNQTVEVVESDVSSNQTLEVVESDDFSEHTSEVVESDDSSNDTSEVVESDDSSNQTSEVVESDDSSNQTSEVVESDDSSNQTSEVVESDGQL